MKRTGLLILIFMLLNVPMTAAQDGWPPVVRADDLFADSVEVVETLPVLNADNTQRVFYYRAPGTDVWTNYPYPDDLSTSSTPRLRSDGTYLVGDTRQLSLAVDGETWIFDSIDGAFSRSETVCGRVRALPGEGQWFIYRASDGEPHRLCNSATGMLTLPFPDELQPDLCDTYHRPASESPGGQWVVIADCAFRPEPFGLYAFEIVTGVVTFLGVGSAVDNEAVEVVRWADDTHPIVRSSMAQNESLVTFAIADVTRSGSLTPIYQTQRGGSTFSLSEPVFYDDPPRMEWIPGEFDRSALAAVGQAEACRLHAFSLTTFETTVYPSISGVCGQGMPLASPEDRVYHAVRCADGDRACTGALIRFNPYTGESASLFEGSVIRVELASADGRYAVLTLDDSEAALFYSALSDALYPLKDYLVQPSRVVFDVSERKPVAVFPAHWSEDRGDLVPILSPLDGDRWLMEDQTEDGWNLTILDAASGSVTSVLAAPLDTDYSLDVSRTADGLWLVEIADPSAGTGTPFLVGRWVIRIA
jgi:hypothetical protein